MSDVIANAPLDTERKRLMVGIANELDVALRRLASEAMVGRLFAYARRLEGLRVEHEKVFDEESRRV